MNKDNRIYRDEIAINFSCKNRRFSTDIKKGFSHGSYSKTKGSVYVAPLIESNGYTLWLEYAKDDKNNNSLFRLMWYGAEGKPTIPLSAVFNKDDLGKMIGQLTQFMP